MTKIIEITPNKSFSIKKNYIPLILNVSCLIGGFVLFFIYLKKFDKSQNENPSKKILYISFVLMVIAVICSFIIMLNYIQMFNSYPSSVFACIFFLFAASTGGLCLIIAFLKKNVNFCPPGKIFSSQYNLCVNDCPEGTFLDDDGFCDVGCISDRVNNCPNGQQCINNKCCDETTHEIFTTADGDEVCCKKGNISKDDKGGQHCCRVWCKNGCCGDFDGSGAKCENGQCMIQCGDNNYCNVDNDEACFCADDGKKKICHCDDKGSFCQITTTIIPDVGGNFQAAYEIISNDDAFNKKKEEWLNIKEVRISDFMKKYEEALENNRQNTDMYICGDAAKKFVRFRQIKGENCNNYEQLFKEAGIQMTEFNFVQDKDKNMVYLNIIENPALPKHAKGFRSHRPSKIYSTVTDNDGQTKYDLCLSDQYMHDKDGKCVCYTDPDIVVGLDENCECPDGTVWNLDFRQCIPDPQNNSRPLCEGKYRDYGTNCNTFFPQCLVNDDTTQECPANIITFDCSFQKNNNDEWVGLISDPTKK